MVHVPASRRNGEAVLHLRPRNSESNSRYTREETVRLEAISIGIKRTGSYGLWTLIIVTGGGALIGAGFALPFTNDWRWWAFGAAVSAALFLSFVLFVVWDILHRLVERLGQSRPVEMPMFAGDSPRSQQRVEPPPFDEEHKLRQCRRWFVAIHHGDATLSQDGTRDGSKVGGRAYGLSAEECSHVKEWAVGMQWYYVISERNSTGDWTELGERALAALARGEPWAYVLSMRWRDRQGDDNARSD